MSVENMVTLTKFAVNSSSKQPLSSDQLSSISIENFQNYQTKYIRGSIFLHLCLKLSMSLMQIYLNFEPIKNKVKYTVRAESVMEDKGCSRAVYMLI